MECEFKINNTLEKRINQFDKLKKEYPTKIPIILEKAHTCTLNQIIKSKYILSNDLTMAEFITIIKDKLELEPERALFFLAKGKYNISGNQLLGDIYERYKDKDDGFLYITYSEEVIYG